MSLLFRKTLGHFRFRSRLRRRRFRGGTLQDFDDGDGIRAGLEFVVFVRSIRFFDLITSGRRCFNGLLFGRLRLFFRFLRGGVSRAFVLFVRGGLVLFRRGRTDFSFFFLRFRSVRNIRQNVQIQSDLGENIRCRQRNDRKCDKNEKAFKNGRPPYPNTVRIPQVSTRRK